MLEANTEDKNGIKNNDTNENEEESEDSKHEKEGEQMLKLNKTFVIEMNLIGDKKKIIFIIKTLNMQIKNSMLVILKKKD